MKRRPTEEEREERKYLRTMFWLWMGQTFGIALTVFSLIIFAIAMAKAMNP